MLDFYITNAYNIWTSGYLKFIRPLIIVPLESPKFEFWDMGEKWGHGIDKERWWNYKNDKGLSEL